MKRIVLYAIISLLSLSFSSTRSMAKPRRVVATVYANNLTEASWVGDTIFDDCHFAISKAIESPNTFLKIITRAESFFGGLIYTAKRSMRDYDYVECLWQPLLGNFGYITALEPELIFGSKYPHLFPQIEADDTLFANMWNTPIEQMEINGKDIKSKDLRE